MHHHTRHRQGRWATPKKKKKKKKKKKGARTDGADGVAGGELAERRLLLRVNVQADAALHVEVVVAQVQHRRHVREQRRD